VHTDNEIKAPVLIREFETRDHDQWLPLWKGYQAFYKSSIPDAVSQESWRRMLDPNEPTFGALAFAGSEALGMVHWIFHRSNWTTGDYCYLQDLYVREDNRGLGIGRLLIEHVYDAARKAGSPRVYWLTHETNAKAMLLYDRIAERSGFVQYKKLL
jgi:GNAT superfamily N-acetyltransferase